MNKMSGCILCGNPAIPGVEKPPNSCQLSNGHSCPPCRQMKELEAQIYESKNALEKLVARHRELRSEANRAHIPSPLRVPEIASTIFQLSLPEPEELEEISSKSTSRSLLAAPLPLGAVCRSWRQIAWSTPQLWSCISIELDPPKFPTRSEQVQQWLARSGQLPLSISVNTIGSDLPSDTAIFDQVFDIVNGYSSRWYYLNLEIPPSMISRFVGDSQGISVLHTLKLHPSDYDESGQFKLIGGQPSPSNAEFQYLRLKTVNIAWDNLTHVEATAFHIDECIELLWRTSNLTRCKFVDVLAEANHFLIPNKPVVVPRLQLLDFNCQEFLEDVDLFFDHITLPSLQQFELCMCAEDLPSESLQSLFRRSSCSLRHLEVYRTSFNDTKFNELLRTTPSLKMLKFEPEFWGAYAPDSLFRWLADTSRISQDSRDPSKLFLPELQSITLLFTPLSPVPWHLVPDIFGSLSEIDKCQQRPLRELLIIFEQSGGKPPIFIDQETIPRLLELTNAGISLRLQFRTSETDLDFLQLSMEHHGITK